jgi:hypothetical protein
LGGISKNGLFTSPHLFSIFYCDMYSLLHKKEKKFGAGPYALQPLVMGFTKITLAFNFTWA